MQKLRYLKRNITNPNKLEFGKVEIRKSKTLEDLKVLEQSTEGTEGTQLSPSEANQMITLRVELQQLAKAEEISWRQQSRCL